jgi:pimeloyl-ACP methyl ester carboxylesterase
MGVAVLFLVLGLLQLALEGFYWQLLPAYVLALICAFITIPRATGITGMHWLARTAIRLAILLPLGVLGLSWILLPVPLLPQPTGPYAVGTEIYRWVDAGRLETATTAGDDNRNVVVQAWYPAQGDASGPGLPYVDGLSRLPDMVSFIPSLFMRNYGDVDTHAVASAAISADSAQWPVILFSPGYGAPRSGYTSLLTNLASYGYIVLAIDHPYEVAVTELADGTIAVPAVTSLGNDAAADLYMAEQQTVRADDLSFVLNAIRQAGTLGPVLDGHLDLAHIAAIGHSFGGAAAALLAVRDASISAAINIDGTLYGDLPSARLQQPFMLIQSDQAETGHSLAFIEANGALLANGHGTTVKHEISQANHYSFTDMPLYFSPPARFALTFLVGGSRGPEATIDLTTTLIRDFLVACPTRAA